MRTDDPTLARVEALVRHIPWTTDEACHLLYELALALNAREIVEVATGYGKSTTYLAAAAERNRGMLYSVDNVQRGWRRRSPADLLELARLSSWCKLSTGVDARWYLIEMMSKRSACWVDLAFIDAAHVVEVDAFIALALWTHLREGGILVMDDLDWTQADHSNVKKRLSRPETMHVRALFDYLRQLPNAGKSFEWGAREISWSYGIIQKAGGTSRGLDIEVFLRRHRRRMVRNAR